MSSGEPRDVLRPSLFERLVGDESNRRGVDLRVGVRELHAPRFAATSSAC